MNLTELLREKISTASFQPPIPRYHGDQERFELNRQVCLALLNSPGKPINIWELVKDFDESRSYFGQSSHKTVFNGYLLSARAILCKHAKVLGFEREIVVKRLDDYHATVIIPGHPPFPWGKVDEHLQALEYLVSDNAVALQSLKEFERRLKEVL